MLHAMTDPSGVPGADVMITLECPWCAAPALLIDDERAVLIVCAECAVSAPIAPDGPAELAAAA